MGLRKSQDIAETRDLQESLYVPGKNCYRKDTAEQASLLIDCHAYYGALYKALCAAKHSIFILGWDIDGRIELVRGEDAENQEYPPALFDLIKKKALENPNLKIYLNKWNYSIFFAKEREPFCGMKWHFRTPSNVHFCSDYKLPFGACHHQKIIIVDDELAFCGGMDIALGRWDSRSHHSQDVEERVDPGGFLTAFKKLPYGPYHDIQFMMCGPAVRILADIARWRWQRAAGYDAIPFRESGFKECSIWPENVKPHFKNISIAVARTIPRTRNHEMVREILPAYIDEIAQAEKFIYIENQYLTCKEIARALNKRMREKPELRVLAVSTSHPRGFMEHKVMSTGRVMFSEIVNDGIEDGRFRAVYPVCKEGDVEKTIHIHSKLMIVDDKILHIGSANLNHRSMGFDTECDMLIEGTNQKTRAQIAALRTDLIREHTGLEKKHIEDLINNDAPLSAMMSYKFDSTQHIKSVDDGEYADEPLARQAIKLGDPSEAYILNNLPIRQIVTALFLLGVFWAMIWTWFDPVFSDFFSKETAMEIINKARDSHFTPLWIVGIYIIGGLIFFPIMMLNLTTTIMFGPIYGFLYSFLGSLASASVIYVIGHFLGEKTLFMFRNLIEKARTYANRGGIIGMTLIRFIPIAPFTLVNLTFGLIRVSFVSYIVATFLGLLPGITAKAIFGGAIGKMWDNPDPKVIFYVAGSLLLWFGIMWTSQRVAKHYKTELDL